MFHAFAEAADLPKVLIRLQHGARLFVVDPVGGLRSGKPSKNVSGPNRVWTSSGIAMPGGIGVVIRWGAVWESPPVAAATQPGARARAESRGGFMTVFRLAEAGWRRRWSSAGPLCLLLEADQDAVSAEREL